MSTTGTPASAQLHRLGERWFRTQHTLEPFNSTMLGLSEFDHLAGDPSRAAGEQAATTFAGILGELGDLDTEELTDDERVDRAALTELVRGSHGDATHALWAASTSAGGYVSRQGLIFQAVPAMTITDEAGAERYLQRLQGIPAVLEALAVRGAEEAALGRPSARVGLEQALGQITAALKADEASDSLLAPARGSAVLEQATKVVQERIRPALERLAQAHRDLLAGARDDEHVGIRFVAGGEEGYADAVRRHTTTERSAQELHDLGLQLIDELRGRWAEIGGRAFGLRDLPSIAARLREDPALRYSSPENMIERCQAALAKAEAAAGRAFDLGEIPPCSIESISGADAEGAATAYYRLPAVDGSRPGVFFLTTSGATETPGYDCEALTFHEAVPGHHLQLSSLQQAPVPYWRRYIDIELGAYTEGWGLYAERLAEDLDLYSDDVQRLGMLSLSALRAARLVVDTGMHALGWSRARAEQYMRENTTATEHEIRSEVVRYVGWPGQALGYATGRQELLRLREASGLDLTEFHRTVLGHGSLPLTVLAGLFENRS
ncbi:hypothetical protein Kisp01_59600 [Kineosporia sp. NBRC 101677]|uniref:DUF885 domain-containing protein n=1 Tax=Kineosporia sp. NBRC 101677 TaxID=3032197 RepID=UPI0024A3BA8E|nr:DUF885 domain-containing protein [Kineosporia sp. NBRC 101677]GLY18946.1 hypothetical protein Kisp01_59600 [Kineosporia sp. NBRC 101677]